MNPEEIQARLVALKNAGASDAAIQAFLTQARAAPAPEAPPTPTQTRQERALSEGAALTRRMNPMAFKPTPEQRKRDREELSATASSATFGLARFIPGIRRGDDAVRARSTGVENVTRDVALSLPAAALGGPIGQVGKTVLSRLAARAGLGGILGGGSALAHSATEEDPAGRPEAALLGGGIGAGLNALLPPILSKSGKLVKAIGNKLSRPTVGALSEQQAVTAAAPVAERAGFQTAVQDAKALTPEVMAQARPLASLEGEGGALFRQAAKADPTIRDLGISTVKESDAAITSASAEIQRTIGSGPQSPVTAIDLPSFLGVMPKESRATVQKVLRPFIAEHEAKVSAQVAQSQAGVPAPVLAMFQNPALSPAAKQSLLAQFPGLATAGQVPPPLVLTREMLDVARKGLGSAVKAAGDKPARQYLVTPLKEAKDVAETTLESEAPEWGNAMAAWKGLKHERDKLLSETGIRDISSGGAPLYRAPAASAASETLPAMAARGIAEGATGRVSPGMIHGVTEVIRRFTQDVSDAQAVDLARRFLQAGPEAWGFAQKVIDEAARSGTKVNRAQLSSLLGRLTAGHVGAKVGDFPLE